MDSFVKLLDALTRLVGVCIWPVFAGIVLASLNGPIVKLLSNVADLNVKAPGFEITAKLQAAAALGAAVANQSNPPENKQAIASEVAKAIDSSAPQGKGRKSVLWVDDNPDNNIYEREALRAFNVDFVLAKSTSQALADIRDKKFDAIISDMSRPPDNTAGYTLLSQLGANHPPFIVYSSVDNSETEQEARRRGAVGSTNNPATLFGLVLGAIGKN